MITLDTIMSTDPCPDYPRERVAELLGGSGRTTTIQEIARDDRIPAADRIWLLSRLRPKIAVGFAKWCAERAAARSAAAWVKADAAAQAAEAAARAADTADAADYATAAQAASASYDAADVAAYAATRAARAAAASCDAADDSAAARAAAYAAAAYASAAYAAGATDAAAAAARASELAAQCEWWALVADGGVA